MIIYKIINDSNNKCYIGQTTQTMDKRISQHLRRVKNKINRPLYNAINKYGWNHFKIEIITTPENQELLDEKEKYYIKELNTISPNGYNLMDGGSYGKHSQETKLKMSLAKKGKKKVPFTQEHKNNISSSLIGKPGRNTGNHHTEQSKKLMSLAHIGKCFSEKTKYKMSIAQKLIGNKPPSSKGRLCSEEVKMKIRLSNIGKKRSKETRSKISLAAKRRIISEETKIKHSLSAKAQWKRRHAEVRYVAHT